MNTKTLAKTMFFTCSTFILCASLPGFADNSQPYGRKNNCASIDLKKGTNTTLPDNIEFVVSPTPSPKDNGYYETVLKITIEPEHGFAPKAHNFNHKTARFSVTYDGIPMGNSVNIGDSATNDGGAGDAGTQSKDAEMQIGRQGDTSGALDPDSTMWIYGHDGYPAVSPYGPAISIVPNSVKKGDTITLDVANESFNFDNPATPLSGVFQSPWLYALNGQPDTEGPVNYDIFAAFNRVVSVYSGRTGSGVGKVKVCLLNQ